MDTFLQFNTSQYLVGLATATLAGFILSIKYIKPKLSLLLGDTQAFNESYSYGALGNHLFNVIRYTVASTLTFIIALLHTNVTTDFRTCVQFTLLTFLALGGAELLLNFFYRVQHSYRESRIRLGKKLNPFNWLDKLLYKVYGRNFNATVAMEVVKLGSEKYALVKLADGYYVGGHVLENSTPSLYLDTYDSKHIIGLHKFQDKPEFFIIKKDSPQGADILHTVDEFYRNREEVAPMVANAIVSQLVKAIQGEDD